MNEKLQKAQAVLGRPFSIKDFKNFLYRGCTSKIIKESKTLKHVYLWGWWPKRAEEMQDIMKS